MFEKWFFKCRRSIKVVKRGKYKIKVMLSMAFALSGFLFVNVEKINAAIFTPDGTYVLSIGVEKNDKTLILWEVSSGRPIRPFTGHTGWVCTVVLSPDGKYALSGGNDESLRLWEVSTGKEIKTFWGHRNIVTDVTISPDGRYAVSTGGVLESDPHTLKLWDLIKGEEIWTLKGRTGEFGKNVLSPDGKYILSGGRTLKLLEGSNGKVVRTFEGNWSAYGAGGAVAFSPDGKHVFAGTSSGVSDYIIRLWEVSTGKEIRQLLGHSNFVRSIALSHNGRYALSGSKDKTLKLWEVATSKEIRTFHGHSGGVNSVSLSPDGKYALSQGDDNVLKLWEVNTGKVLRTFR